MKYIIYEMVQPSFLKEIEPDGYCQKTIYRDVLQRLNISKIKEEHPTIDSAISEINSNRHLLKHLRLTIVPVIDISCDGEIR
jgi:hypothetical protein